ncbi:branched-chain amino acid ABC transporter permease [Pseudaminobacter soli (ex Li et al. 2025)]|uniref:Branched-chain amino acid ABC transporter permease n=1 Tax=Pseudaminobacter soli (ex Li et al. 2025) TaxID=1295366 RepID=A0A2P7RLF3_9HYPH|nr:branched-chain amino acid ABC transporter permease [Mesorhizobium soli]PSJ51047.1 branched-chain amino acid ABC transporter permease [Mesorhizobium soli]
MSLVVSPSMVQRWTRLSRRAAAAVVIVLLGLAVLPGVLGAGAIDRLAALFVYVIMAAMWNALAGYGGLVSVGQQMFFGLGAYFTVRLAETGLDPFVAMGMASLLVAVVSYPLSLVMLRLKGGEFAIGMWVVSALTHLMVNLDGLIQGETGRSLISLNAYAPGARRDIIYWLALVAMTGLLGGLFALLRNRTGASIQAIRDNEEAAGSLGIDVTRTKRLIFVLAAFGIGVAGALWLASATTFQPKTYFSVQWTAYMIFMVLVGGIGRFEGAILGAVIFFLIETWFGALGVWYLIGLGVVALLFSLFMPLGLWGAIETRFGVSLMPVGYRLEIPPQSRKD